MELGSRTMYIKPGSIPTYSSFVLFGQSMLENEKKTALKCLDEILSQRDAEEVITLADYGTADGGNVARFMNYLIDHIQDVKGPKQEINIILEDQCHNDFNALFRTVKGLRGQEAIKESDSVHLLVSGNSMYNRCLPHRSVDFGVSTMTVHWLSNWTSNLKPGTTCYTADEEEMKIISQQAARDWKTFVINRGKEMKSGAYFLVECPTDSKRKASVFRELIQKLNHMAEEDIITRDELKDCNAPCHSTRPLEELLQVFSEPDVQTLGLELVSYKKFDLVVLEPITEELVDDAKVAEHIRTLMMYIKIWLSNSIIHGLSKYRDPQETLAVTEEVFDRLQKHLEKLKWTKGIEMGYGGLLFRKK